MPDIPAEDTASSAAPDAPSRTRPIRWRIDLGYDGTDFSGWARQPGLRTVQDEVEHAVALVGRTSDVSLTCAGRTDAGVHARHQVAHVDLGTGVGEALSTRRLNGVLPSDITVHRIRRAPEGFDARFSAIYRRYVYRLADTDAGVDPLRRREVYASRPLALDPMRAAAAGLLGLHDFAAFCKARDGATTIRTLTELTIVRTTTEVVEMTVVADAFCHSMVRALVGALVAVGESRASVQWPAQVLAARRRHPAVRVMPPGGLTLEEVGYPDDSELAARAAGSRALRFLPAD
jgi:tRNA pseudouridine38-40 synthase